MNIKTDPVTLNAAFHHILKPFSHAVPDTDKQLRPVIGSSHLPLMVAGFRSVCGEGSSEPPCLLDRDWNNACTFAKDISWAVCMCEKQKQT